MLSTFSHHRKARKRLSGVRPGMRFRCSVGIVTRDNEMDIGACLAAAAQIRVPHEIHLIDNASRDGTRDAVQRFQKRTRGVRLKTTWNRANEGYAAAMNRAMRESRGSAFLCLGPDTVLGRGAVEMLLRHLYRHPQTGAAAPQLKDPSGRPQPSCRKLPTPRDVLFELTALPRLFPQRFRPAWKNPDIGRGAAWEIEQPEATCLLLRRDTIEAVGFFDERFPIFFNDVDYCRRIREAGWRILFVPGAVVRHVRGASIRQRPAAMVWKSHQGFYRYFRKHAVSPWGNLWVQALGCLLIAAAFARTVLLESLPERRYTR